MHHVGQYRRLKSGCVRIDQKEQWIIRQNLRAKLYERINTLLDFPDFPFRSPPVGRRVHNDRIVMIATADFTLHKLHAVIHKPADRGITESG